MAFTVDSPFTSVAIALYEMGYKPLPLAPGKKYPGEYLGRSKGWITMKGWNKWCMTDMAEKDIALWSRWPEANVGVVHTHAFIGIDFDEDVGGCHDEIKALLADIPGVVVRRYGSKGYMQYFRSEGVRTRVYPNGEKRNMLEVLAHGRQSVLPPSIHPDTDLPYQWVTEDTLADTPLDKLPLVTAEIQEQIETILKEQGWDPQASQYTRVSEYADESTSKDDLWSRTNRYAMADLTRWVEDLNLPRWEHKGNGGYCAVAAWRPSGGGRALEDRKLNLHIDPLGIIDFGTDERYTPSDLVMKALGKDFGDAWRWLYDRVAPDGFELPEIDGDWGFQKQALEEVEAEIVRVEEAVQALKVKHSYEDDVFSPRRANGLIREVAEWCLRTGMKPSPEYALMAGIGVTAALYARKFRSPTDCGLNVYMIGVGRSGFGKDHPQNIAAMALSVIQGEHNQYVGPSDFSSDAALHLAMRSHGSRLFIMDEIGLFLQGIQGARAAGHEVRARKALLELYSKSSSIWSARMTAAEESNREHLINPCLSVMGFATPETLFEGLKKENLRDGLLARFLVFSVDKRPARNPAPEKKEVTDSVQRSVEWAMEQQPLDSTKGHSDFTSTNLEPGVNIIPFAGDDAAAAWAEIDDWCNEECDRDPHNDGIFNRIAENTIRLATLRALSRDGANAVVTVDDVCWGASLVNVSVRTLVKAVETHMADNEVGKNMNDVEQLIQRETKARGQISMGMLVNKRRSLTSRDMEDIIKKLLLAGRIEELQEKTRKGARVFKSIA